MGIPALEIRTVNTRSRAFIIAVMLVAIAGVAADGAELRRRATWGITTKVGPDAKAGGWFINLGLTGARAKILLDRPREFEVTYLFPGTPAEGKLKAGDHRIKAELLAAASRAKLNIVQVPVPFAEAPTHKAKLGGDTGALGLLGLRMRRLIGGV